MWLFCLTVHHCSLSANQQGCSSQVSARTDVYFTFFGFNNAEQLDCKQTQHKDMQTNRGSLCWRPCTLAETTALQNQLLKSQPWNLPGLSSIAELKVHVFKGFETSRGFCAVEEAPALCGEIRAQDNRVGLHERPNAESRAVGIIRGLTVEMKREERKPGVDGLASVTGNYGVLQVGDRHSDGWLPLLIDECSRD